MIKWFRYCVLLIVVCLSQNLHANAPTLTVLSRSTLDNMPYVIDSSLPEFVAKGSSIEEKRGEEYRYYLQSSVRIRVPSAKYSVYGSGTICYYDKSTNTAYIISCGHLFSGNRKPSQPYPTCEVHVFYNNNVKLDKFKVFKAEVVCYDNNEDISILKFQPDWEPNYFPIASAEYQIKIGDIFESVGCDEAEETASYTVQVVKGVVQGEVNLITKMNMARQGRSGGGLLSKDGYYIGIVWGAGRGYTYYVPLWRIHRYLKQFSETAFLLKVDESLIKSLPIVPRIGKIPPGFVVPLPK